MTDDVLAPGGALSTVEAVATRAPLGGRDAVGAIVAFAFAFGLCLAVGRLGYMPLDQSIVFDGAWRLLSGQVPFRDFTLPNGVVPIVLQAGLFALFGVNWLTYLLHAAVLNGLFAAMIGASLRLLGAPRALAWLLGAASGVVFYAPMGTPYMDQHAFFFSAAALVAAIAAREAPAGAKARWWAAVPVLWVLAYASKQIPSVFVAPVLALLLLAEWRNAGRCAVAAAAGLAAAIAVPLVAAWGTGVSWPAFRHATWELPAALGAQRLDSLLNHQLPLDAVFGAGAGWGMLAPWLVLLGGPVVAYVALKAPRRLDAAALAIGAFGLVVACFLFSLLSNNQAANGIAYAFWALGLLAIATLRLVAPAGFRAVLAAQIAFGAFALLDAATFYQRVDAGRLVHDEAWTPDGQDAPVPALWPMRWSVSKSYASLDGRNVAALAAFLDTHPGNFFLLGDASILYGLTRRPSVNPALWFHPGLTMPTTGSPGFDAYLASLRTNLKRYDVRYVVVENDTTWMGLPWSALEPAFAPGALRRAAVQRFGDLVVLTLPR